MRKINELESVEYYNSRPGIHTGGGWDPGESPRQVAIRECREEIGCCPTPLIPAFVNYIPPREDGSKDVIHFVYTAEPVDDDFLEKLRPQEDEIDDITFVPIPEIDDYMKEYRVRAVHTYLRHRVANAMIYLEDGVMPVHQSGAGTP